MTIELYVSGYGFSRRRTESIVSWFNNKYLKRFKVELEVLHRGLKREEVLGYCDISGRTRNPREFLIELQSNLDEETYTSTLIHECVHLLDFVKGDLKIKSCRKYYKGIDVEEMDYEDQPHEIRAYEAEEELYKEYITFLST